MTYPFFFFLMCFLSAIHNVLALHCSQVRFASKMGNIYITKPDMGETCLYDWMKLIFL